MRLFRTHALVSLGFLLVCGVLDVRVLEYIGPKAGDLMRIVDLHHVELLHNLLINLDLSALESWDHFLAQVDGQDVVQPAQGLDLFIGLYK